MANDQPGDGTFRPGIDRQKPQIVVANKVDLPVGGDGQFSAEEIAQPYRPLHVISADHGGREGAGLCIGRRWTK